VHDQEPECGQAVPLSQCTQGHQCALRFHVSNIIKLLPSCQRLACAPVGGPMRQRRAGGRTRAALSRFLHRTAMSAGNNGLPSIKSVPRRQRFVPVRSGASKCCA
jgi:hypothetical protein